MNLDRYKKDLDQLISKGELLHLALLIDAMPAATTRLTEQQRKNLPDVRRDYQIWYSEALATIRQLMPDRVDDFVGYYKPLKPRKELNSSTYRIADYLQRITASQGGRQIVGFDAAVSLLEQQVQIVRALEQRFQSSLFDIRALTQADLFDNELDAAVELNRKGFHRAAGAVAGVVLEGHLANVCDQHQLIKAKNPSIGELNDLLKKGDALDIPTWRFVQHLGDLRNLCDHKKSDDPTKDQMSELIDGTRKIIKTVF